MEQSNKLLNLLRDINRIQAEYKNYNTTDALQEWVKNCIYSSITGKRATHKSTFDYEDCHIEYFDEQALFSLVKAKRDMEGYSTTVLSDAALSIRPYLLLSFGTDRVSVIQKASALILIEDELDDLSRLIHIDIDMWCKTV